MYCFFFFKQKTAYEVRISDWSSDVCSSDLAAALLLLFGLRQDLAGRGMPPLSMLAFWLTAATGLAATWSALRMGLPGVGRDYGGRSEERPVGKECVSKCRYRWLPDD